MDGSTISWLTRRGSDDVRRALCHLSRDIPRQGPWDRKRSDSHRFPRVRRDGTCVRFPVCLAHRRVSGVLSQAPVIALYANLATAAPVYISGGMLLFAGFLALLLPYEPRGKVSI